MGAAILRIRRFDEPDERRDFPLGRFEVLQAGGLFEIGPGHDSVVVGDERHVSIHFLGAEQYSAT